MSYINSLAVIFFIIPWAGFFTVVFIVPWMEQLLPTDILVVLFDASWTTGGRWEFRTFSCLVLFEGGWSY